MYKNVKQGWYGIKNPSKFRKPMDEYMQSYRDGKVQYKSSLEQKAFRYADINPKIVNWSVEPFHVKYVKPTDNKYHRYFIDMFLEFENGQKFIVEVKSKGETTYPKKPSKNTQKAMLRYKEAVMTYMINESKWKAATEFANKNGCKFIILTEDQLN